jgi:hypothetical protein
MCCLIDCAAQFMFSIFPAFWIEIQITRPYHSLTCKSQCITISALIDAHGGKLVVCLDLDWS